MSTKAFHVLIFQIPDFENNYSDIFYSMGCQGIEPAKGMRIKVYFDGDKDRQHLEETFKTSLPNLKLLSANTFGLEIKRPSQIHSEEWKLFDDLKIVGPDAFQNKENEICIKAGAAFGSGKHMTTILTAEMIRKHMPPKSSFLDIGCGTGILMLLANKFGAGTLTGVDISKEALENASINFETNGIEEKTSLKNSLQEIETSHEFIVANVLAPTLIHLQKQISMKTSPGGTLILCGITTKEWPNVLESYEQNFTLIENESSEGWIVARFRKK